MSTEITLPSEGMLHHSQRWQTKGTVIDEYKCVPVGLPSIQDYATWKVHSKWELQNSTPSAFFFDGQFLHANKKICKHF
jgi:hypothetical protein